MRHIASDSLEHSRIRLERDIDNNIPSPPSMSSDFVGPDDDDLSSVDFPRHNSHHPSFHSFEHASHLDSDFYSRHGDDDSIALDPDLGYTMSTAAHHASALTLSAGLRGRSAYNHTSGIASPSGAEYDPDRPLQAMLNSRVADGISLFDPSSRSKSQNQTRTVPSFDPVVVDSTVELDRFLRTGHTQPTRLVYPYQSRSHSQPASETSDSDVLHPRLAHALGSNFSPKRPRSTPVPVVNPASRNTMSRTDPSRPTVHPSKSERTALPAKQQPVRVTSTIPKDGPKDSDATPRPSRRTLFPPAPRAPFSELGNKHARIHLPDVTGLTSAVQSPAKNDAAYPDAQVRALDLLPALDALQTRLQALEHANSVSRRRVRELEHELEGCRAEVLAERTRIEERERETAHARAGRHRAVEESRYHSVVAEKKALEALLASLRTHLARLTAELTTHKTLIESLRKRTGHDARAEIQALRAEVERLAGEVERLKTVVEEGLRERQRAKRIECESDHSRGDDGAEDVRGMPAQVGIDITYVTAPVQRAQSSREVPLTMDDLQSGQEQEEQERGDDQEHEYPHGREHLQDHENPQAHYQEHEYDEEHMSERDHQEVPDEQEDFVHDSETRPDSNPSVRYIRASELARVEAEMHERRSERSRSSVQRSGDNDSGIGSSLSDVAPVPSVSMPRHNPRARISADTKEDRENENPSPASSAPRPTPRLAPLPRTPFPQIRGSRMERLFFSAPEHNVRTCAVCHRRKRRAPAPREFKMAEDGDVDADADIVHTYLRKRRQQSKGTLGHSDGDGDGDRPPPQTVLTRVVRELEDDFSHYKAIYLELAEQYGVMDAVSNVAKRNVLADHLRDVIDTLEQKGDQIASLYDLLTFKDKPFPRLHETHQKRAAFT